MDQSRSKDRRDVGPKQSLVGLHTWEEQKRTQNHNSWQKSLTFQLGPELSAPNKQTEFHAPQYQLNQEAQEQNNH